MSTGLRIPLACLVLQLLTGCNLAIAGAFVQPYEGARPEAYAGAQPTVFNLAPAGAIPLVSAAARAAAAWPTDGGPIIGVGLVEATPTRAVDPGAARAYDHIVKLVGRAHISKKARGIANVRDGLVTGSPVHVIDAQTGRTLSTAVSFYDGSFTIDVRFRSASSAVLLVTELIDAADPTLKATISAPVHLRAADAERIVQITPGSTALTSFLQAVATMQDTGDAANAIEALPDDPSKLALVTSPRLGALIVSLKDGEDASYAMVMAASPELSNAESVAGLRAAIMKFVGRLSVKKATP